MLTNSVLPLPAFPPISDEGVRLWVVSQLKALCGWTPPPGEEESRHVQQKVLSGKDTVWFQSSRLVVLLVRHGLIYTLRQLKAVCHSERHTNGFSFGRIDSDQFVREP